MLTMIITEYVQTESHIYTRKETRSEINFSSIEQFSQDPVRDVLNREEMWERTENYRDNTVSPILKSRRIYDCLPLGWEDDCVCVDCFCDLSECGAPGYLELRCDYPMCSFCNRLADEA